MRAASEDSAPGTSTPDLAAIDRYVEAERRAELERFATKFFPNEKQIRLSPATTKLEQAQRWFAKAGRDLAVRQRADAGAE